MYTAVHYRLAHTQTYTPLPHIHTHLHICMCTCTLRDAVRFCFGPILQKELDEFRDDWNNHRIRKSTMAETLGGIPELLYFAPAHCGQLLQFYILTINVLMAPLTGSWLMLATCLYSTCTFVHLIPLTPHSQYWPSSGLVMADRCPCSTVLTSACQGGPNLRGELGSCKMQI